MIILKQLEKKNKSIQIFPFVIKDDYLITKIPAIMQNVFFYSSQPLQTSHQPVAPDTSSSSEGVSFTEVNEFPPAG